MLYLSRLRRTLLKLSTCRRQPGRAGEQRAALRRGSLFPSLYVGLGSEPAKGMRISRLFLAPFIRDEKEGFLNQEQREHYGAIRATKPMFGSFLRFPTA